jgi:hypothetical protein
MNEHEFFAQHSMRTWKRSDFENALPSAPAFWLCAKLWGDVERMTRQLLANRPEIPTGLGLPELRALERMLVYFGRAWPATPGIPKDSVIIAGGLSYTMWQARYEIVRRAIEFLERR